MAHTGRVRSTGCMTTTTMARVRRTAMRWAVRRIDVQPDLTSLERLPPEGRFVLQRNGVDPVPALDGARTPDGIVHVTRMLGLDVWLATGHDAARTVLADRDGFGNDIRHLLGGRPRSAAEQVGGLGMTDDPEHGRLRRVLTPEFTRRRLARLEEPIERIVAEALDDMERRGPVVDLVERFAFEVPFRVICDLLGLPEVDRAAFRGLGTARFDMRAGGRGSFGAAATSRSFLIDAVGRERARGSVGEGLIASLLREHGDDLDDVELGGLADGLFLGGYETSASMLSLGTYVLLRDPASYELLRTGDRGDVDRVVEELLRYVCPVQVAFPRFARHDLVVGSARVKQGDVVMVSLTGANRDPQAGAGSFDPRPGRSPGHVAFGHGAHRCLGAELARMELRSALTGLAVRFPGLALAVDPDELRFTELSAVYGVEALPVRLGRASPAS